MKLLRRYHTKHKFNLTPSNVTGPQLGVFVPWYQDHDVTPLEAVETVRCLKRLEASKQERIVQLGVNELHDMFPLWDYDLIIAIPSSFALVNQIMEAMKRYVTDDKLILGLMTKLQTSDMLIDWEKAKREGSTKTVPLLESFYNRYMQKQGMFEIKGHFAKVRRYLYNFLKLLSDHVSFDKLITAKKILLVDDTYGLGVTMSEALRIIRQVNPTVQANGFCLVHDFPCRTKVLRKFSGSMDFSRA